MFQGQSIPYSEPRDRRIQVVVRLLQNNLREQLAVEEMARLVNLSPGRLAHLFKSEMHLSMRQYVTQLRLMNAKHQLEFTFLSVKEIAAQVGFPSVSSFVGSFKNSAGETPTQYRKTSMLLRNKKATSPKAEQKEKKWPNTGSLYGSRACDRADDTRTHCDCRYWQRSKQS
jgi:transcriptional regulator GlxA family with amidase domain